jgi:demethylmenaquinone methyltransferase/2-methoxy-6-polyprenyl-1,4-benzoquinol methylase
MDFLWRRRAVRVVREWQPRAVLDVATGSGDLLLAIAKALPDAVVTGADFCEPMLDEARRKGARNLVVADALALPFADGSFDTVTVAFGLRNMADWGAALREMARVVHPGGHVLVLDFSLPAGPLRSPYRFYLHAILPRIAGVLTAEPAAYAYLGESIEQFPSGKTMTALLEANGFDDTRHEPLTGGIASLYSGRRR